MERHTQETLGVAFAELTATLEDAAALAAAGQAAPLSTEHLRDLSEHLWPHLSQAGTTLARIDVLLAETKP